MPEQGELLRPPSLKVRMEQAGAQLWFDDLDHLTIPTDNVWGLVDLASKTHFRHTDVLASKVDDCQSCDGCKAQAMSLITTRQHLPYDVFAQESCCLYDWKVAMRVSHNDAPSGPQYDATVSIIKPGSPSNALSTLVQHVGADAIVRVEQRLLTPQDVAFLYTTAYDQVFVSGITNYMTSAPVDIAFLQRPGLAMAVDHMKRAIRTEIGATDTLRNAVHLPDSLYEALGQMYYLFPQETRTYARV